jgi:gamma-glutamyltranspeptidase/glutathione hydrolase
MLSKALVKGRREHRIWGAIGLALGLTLVAGPALAGEDLSAKQAIGRKGMVAAAHPLAAQAGVEMLRKGGSAADAAVATAFALAVVEPFGSSLGGDGTALVFSATTGSIESINYRCAAPFKASYESLDFSDRDVWSHTAKAAGVPGMVAGTCALHERHGSLPLATVMAPAIRYAEEGFEVTPKLASILLDNYAVLEAHEETGAIFLDDGLPFDAGTTIRNPDLAATLRLIAAEGPEAFYSGALAQKIDAYMASSDGLMSVKDLATYKPRIGAAIHTDYRGMTVFTTPPPFGGLAVLQNLNVISQLPFDFGRPYTDEHNLHLLVEVMKGVSRDRMRTLGDPEFVEVPIEFLLSAEYAHARAQLIALDHAVPPREVRHVEAPDRDYEGNTTHFSVVDGAGNAIALTQTLGQFFGCGVTVPGTGILLNNQVRNFSGRPESPNSLRPGKQVRSTQSPTIVTHKGDAILVAGSPGNYRIITTVVQVLVNYLDYGMSIWEALEAARFTSRHSYPTLQVESRFPAETIETLEKKGHKIEVFQDYDLYFGGVHAIAFDPARRLMIGAADRRRDGVAIAVQPLQETSGEPAAPVEKNSSPVDTHN